MQWTTHSPEETRQRGRQETATIQTGGLFALIGNLGSGKTCFVQGMAEGLGVPGPVISPTFILMQVYDIPDHPRLWRLCHVDAYRLQDENELQEVGTEEYLSDPHTLTVIEWADKTPELLGRYSHHRYSFAVIGDAERRITKHKKHPSAE